MPVSWTLKTNADQGNMTYNTDLAQYIYSYAEIKMIFVTMNYFVKFRKENVRSMVKLRPHTGAIASSTSFFFFHL